PWTDYRSGNPIAARARESGQLRNRLWTDAIRTCPAAGHQPGRSRGLHLQILRAISRRSTLHRRLSESGARYWNHANAIRPHTATSRNQLTEWYAAQYGRAHRDQFSDSGDGGGHYQDRHDSHLGGIAPSKTPHANGVTGS